MRQHRHGQRALSRRQDRMSTTNPNENYSLTMIRLTQSGLFLVKNKSEPARSLLAALAKKQQRKILQTFSSNLAVSSMLHS